MRHLKKRIGMIALIIVGAVVIFLAVIIGYFEIMARTSKVEYRDISKYSLCLSGEEALEQFREKGMDESIWPEKITRYGHRIY